MSLRHLEQFADQGQMTARWPTDERGFIGRMCPATDCEAYFKVKPGTGLTGPSLPCHCPYCGQIADSDHFLTKDQVEYIESVLLRGVAEVFQRDLDDFASQFRHGPVTMTFKGGMLPSLHTIREKDLETDITCEACSLQYTIYGLFGFCPDCGVHNSRQILDKNLDMVGKWLALSRNSDDPEIVSQCLVSALSHAVASFDGFGRELCRLHAAKASDPAKAEKVSFQNLSGAQKNVLTLFTIDLASAVTAQEWADVFRVFQKRHVFAHSMGVVDESYLKATQDPAAILGHKLKIDEAEIVDAVRVLRILANFLSSRL